MTSTEELENQIHAQDCELEYWFQQAENYAEVQIPADDLRAIIARTYAAVNALPELLALREENARLREALKLGKIVMDMLDEHGPSIVPHLLDTDENAGQRFRAALKETGQ